MVAKKKYKVVIVGGGFGGVKAAIELADHGGFDITLISSNPNMQVYGSLYHTATGGSKKVSSIPLSEIFSDKNVDIIIDQAAHIDRKTHTISTASGKLFNYQALVIGIGVSTNYFGIKGLKEYSFGIKSLQEADQLKKHLHREMVHKPLSGSHYVVVGGGPTGIEIAGVLPKYINQIAQYHDLPKRKVHVDLIEAAPRLIPRMPKDVSRSVAKNLKKQGVRLYLNTAVIAQTADELLINNKPIRSHTVIWTAGMTNNPFFAENNFQLSQSGKVRVDLYLQAEPGIYIIGDNADTPYSGMAQTALNDGKYVAHSLINIIEGEPPVPYKAKKPVYVMPAGPKWAAVVWGRFRVYGRLGWALRRAADFVAYRDYTSWPMTFSRFIAERDREEPCPLCADELADNKS